MKLVAFVSCVAVMAACSKKVEPAPTTVAPVAPATTSAPAKEPPPAAEPPPAKEPPPEPAVEAKRGANPDAVCEAIAAQSKTAAEAFGKKVAALPEDANMPPGFSVDSVMLPGCVGEGPRAQGTWAIALGEAEIDPDSLKEEAENGVEITVSGSIIWVAADGSELATDVSAALGFFSKTVELGQLHDFDRDGRPELVVNVVEGSPDHRKSSYEVYRATDKGVERLWKDHQPTITGLEDIDNDGILDLAHDSDFEAEQGMNQMVSFPGVTHVVSIDKLERGDEAVRAHYLRKCPKRVAAADIAAGEVDAIVTQATCAWLWGEDNAAIDARLGVLVRDPAAPADEEPMTISGPWSKPGAKPHLTLR